MENDEIEAHIEEWYRTLITIAIICIVLVMLEIALIILLRLGLV